MSEGVAAASAALKKRIDRLLRKKAQDSTISVEQDSTISVEITHRGLREILKQARENLTAADLLAETHTKDKQALIQGAMAAVAFLYTDASGLAAPAERVPGKLPRSPQRASLDTLEGHPGLRKLAGLYLDTRPLPTLQELNRLRSPLTAQAIAEAGVALLHKPPSPSIVALAKGSGGRLLARNVNILTSSLKEYVVQYPKAREMIKTLCGDLAGIVESVTADEAFELLKSVEEIQGYLSATKISDPEICQPLQALAETAAIQSGQIIDTDDKSLLKAHLVELTQRCKGRPIVLEVGGGMSADHLKQRLQEIANELTFDDGVMVLPVRILDPSRGSYVRSPPAHVRDLFNLRPATRAESMNARPASTRRI